MRKGRVEDQRDFTMMEVMASIIIVVGILAVIFAFLRDFLISL